MGLFASMFERSAPRGGQPISGEEARRLVRETGALLVDVRTPAEFAGGHAEAAVNVPLHQLSERLPELSSERPVIVYCRSGGRSAKAARMLGQHGHTVYDARGIANLMR